MRKKRDIEYDKKVKEEEQVAEEQEVELSEKELKKKKLQESAEKRKNARRKDKVARWGGIILLGLIMFVGFLLWVSGEMKQSEVQPPINYQQSGTVIVK